MNEPLASTPDGRLELAHAEANRCIQCGFCLPACPTYVAFGEEKHSPRGRIQLIKSWAEGKTEPDESLETALDVCLDCRACEIACPVDIRYGDILTNARDELAERAADPATSTLTERMKNSVFAFALRHVAARPRRMRRVAGLTHTALHSRAGRWVQKVVSKRPEGWLGAALTFAKAMPKPDAPASVMSGGRKHLDSEPVQNKLRAGLFLGCAQEGMFPETNRASVRLLEKAGWDVTIPDEQVCCGALLRHHGDKEKARALLLRNVRAFGLQDGEEADGYDAVVMNAGGCMAWMKEAAQLFDPASAEHRAVQRLGDLTQDISQIVADSDILVDEREDEEPGPDQEPTGGPRVIYQPSCHLSNVCGISEQPLGVLQRLTGDRAMLPSDGGACCGSAGIYNALHPRESKAILDRKMDSIMEADPDVIVTSNPGCHLQMLAGVQRDEALADRVQVMQLADFVDEHTNRGADGSPNEPPGR